MEEAKLISVAEMMHLLGIGRSTFYRLVNDGEIPLVRIGRRSFVRRADLDDFITRLGEVKKC